jgi:beta-N-acetylhexosaminidase
MAGRPLSAMITGLAGPALTAWERDFLRDVRPCGVILFARNIESAEQIKRLCADARSAIGDAAVPIYIDQEGGRVQRIRPPIGRELLPARAFLETLGDPQRAASAIRLIARLMAHDLKALGINANCVPVLDVPVPGAHDIIGNRAYATSPQDIITLGGAAAQGHLDGGVLPVFKHVPGHGRATADSHLALPIVDTDRATLERTDFVPFRALAHLPIAMTAHVVFTAIDPAAPASTSPTVIRDIIRGHMAFDGLLMCDDLSMKALTGTMRERTRAIFTAGCDLALHCNGDPAEMQAVAAETPRLHGKASERYASATSLLAHEQPFDLALAEAMLVSLLKAQNPPHAPVA